MISETLHMALEKYPHAHYAVAWFEMKNNKRIYSLRSRNRTNVDVSEIAKAHDGADINMRPGLRYDQ